MQEYLDVCREAAMAAGQELLRRLGTAESREKAPKDLVTEADLASQALIERTLLAAFPNHHFLGEESDKPDPHAMDGMCWVADPLDGTTNFVHQLPGFAVSIALVKEATPVVGVVYDPLTQDCYSALRGCGAHLNGQRIRAYSVCELREALIA